MSTVFREVALLLNGALQLDIRTGDDPDDMHTIVARASMGLIDDPEHGLLMEVRSGARPLPWFNAFLRNDALERIARATWIDHALKPALLRHIAYSPDYGMVYRPDERSAPAVFLTPGGLCVCPFTDSGSPTGRVYLPARSMAWHYGTADDGLLGEMRSGLGAIPWESRDAQEEAAKGILEDGYRESDLYSGPMDKQLREDLVRHVLSSPHY